MSTPGPEAKPVISLEEIKKTVSEALRDVRVKIAIMSCKGGVGKSFITANLAFGFAMKGYRVGVLDADLYGPTIPRLMGITGSRAFVTEDERLLPVDAPLGIKVMSMEFLLPSPETAVIWRGPMASGAIRDLLANVVWGILDIFLIDLPPGTGDIPLTITQLLSGELDGIILVTAPNEVSKRVVQKSIAFAKRAGVPLIGIIENMAYFICPNCGTRHYVFGRLVGRELAEEHDIPYLGAIPLDPRIPESIESGEPFMLKYPTSETAKAILEVVDRLIERFKDRLGP